MNSIAQKDDKHFTRGIDPNGCARETCMAERAERKKISPIVGETCVDVPAETTRPAGARHETRASHFGNCQRSKNPHAAILSSIENHLAVNCQIVCRGKESGVAGNATHAI